MRIKRGNVVLVDLSPVIGAEQGNIRPAIVIQNDIGNLYSPTTIVAPITSKVFSKEFPTNVFLRKGDFGLDRDSNILLNQMRTIDKKRLIKRIGLLDSFVMKKINLAIKISLGL